VYFLLRICAAAVLIVLSPYAVTYPLRYHHLHTAFQVSSHIATCYRSIIAVLSCNSTLKNFVFFFRIHFFTLEFILILDSILLTCFLQIAVFFPGAAISLERVSSYVFIGHISLCRQLSQGQATDTITEVL